MPIFSILHFSSFAANGKILFSISFVNWLAQWHVKPIVVKIHMVANVCCILQNSKGVQKKASLSKITQHHVYCQQVVAYMHHGQYALLHLWTGLSCTRFNFSILQGPEIFVYVQLGCVQSAPLNTLWTLHFLLRNLSGLCCL